MVVSAAAARAATRSPTRLPGVRRRQALAPARAEKSGSRIRPASPLGAWARAMAMTPKATARFPKLGQRMDQVAGTLSGGEQQMLALARALVTDPAVVLADELSVGLAPVVVDEIFEALAVLRAEGRSLLLVEQYVERAVGIADYVYILQKGEIVFVGEPSQCASGVVFARYLGASA